MKQDGPSLIIEYPPPPHHGPPNSKKKCFCHIVAHMKTYYYSSFSLLYSHTMYVSNVMRSSHFDIFGFNLRFPKHPKITKFEMFTQKVLIRYFHILYVDAYGWENICEAGWVHYDYWRSPHAPKYILFTMWSIYMKNQLFIFVIVPKHSPKT